MTTTVNVSAKAASQGTKGASRRVAVLFSSVGSGMGDVGKFCVAQALKNPGIELKAVALSAPAEGSDAEITADVTYQEGKDRISEAFSSSLLSLPRVDITSADAQAQIEREIEGCDAVVACLGNRQPSKKVRWLGSGAEVVVAAMKAKGVNRLVNLSSMGIGDDFQPMNFWKAFWWAFLRAVIPSAHKDLIRMEEAVAGSGLDYLLVRCMGLTPEEPPRGTWDLLEARGQGRLGMASSKEDVAAFMLQEAASPQHSKASVTIGYKC